MFGTKAILLSVCLLFSVALLAQSTKNQPVELGNVTWLRDFDQAMAQSKKTEKPVFMLFQEVPGCTTCRNYGQNVLSHPLIVEAIESLFVPLAIYNNRRGADYEVLTFYQEPAWNNPVVHIVAADKQDIIPRISGNYSRLGIVQAMRQALNLRGIAVPRYLQLLEESLYAKEKGTETAILAMHCFWVGEGQYGQMEGIIATEPGFMNGHEVVQIEYDPDHISYSDLIKAGQKADCASHAFANDNRQQKAAQQILGAGKVGTTTSFRSDREPKYYLSRTVYRHIPMTPLQATRANALVGKRQSPDHLFSPRQLSILEKVKTQPNRKWESLIGLSLEEGWRKVVE